MFAALVENIKIIGTCVSAIGACAGGYVYLDGPLPASRQWVMAENATIKERLTESQLQTNTLQRALLRKEQFDRSLDIQKTNEPSVKAVLQERLNSVNDDLETVNRDREKLIKEKEASK